MSVTAGCDGGGNVWGLHVLEVLIDEEDEPMHVICELCGGVWPVGARIQVLTKQSEHD